MLQDTVRRLHRAIESFVAFIRSLPPEALDRRQAWGPREVLAHLAFWHETYVATISALLRHAEPSLPRGTGKELNALAVRQNAGQPIDKLIERLQAAQREIERLAEREESRSLQVQTKEGAKPRTLESLLDAVEAHVRNHEAKLRKELGAPIVGGR